MTRFLLYSLYINYNICRATNRAYTSRATQFPESIQTTADDRLIELKELITAISVVPIFDLIFSWNFDFLTAGKNIEWKFKIISENIIYSNL